MNTKERSPCRGGELGDEDGMGQRTPLSVLLNSLSSKGLMYNVAATTTRKESLCDDALQVGKAKKSTRREMIYQLIQQLTPKKKHL